jgi:hypothetical protein
MASSAPARAEILTMNAEELAKKHRVNGRALRAMLRADQDLTPGHNRHEHYEIDAATEARIVGHPEFAKLRAR